MENTLRKLCQRSIIPTNSDGKYKRTKIKTKERKKEMNEKKETQQINKTVHKHNANGGILIESMGI